LRYDEAAGGRDRHRRTRIHETLEAAIAWYNQRLMSSKDAAPARAYLRRQRGYDGDVVRQYRLGWAPGGRDELLRSLGLPAAALVDAGLATLDGNGRYVDFFRGRILFPIFDAGGQPVGAGGRLLPGGKGPTYPKYKNTANTTVYDKSRTLYGLNWAKKAIVERGRVVVCEGYTDVIGLQRAGVLEAVATCGTALADGHIKALTNFARRIVVAYDADAAGQSAADKFYAWESRYDVSISVVDLPAGSDPADAARDDPKGLLAAVDAATPYLGFRLNRLFAASDLSHPEGRARAAGEAMSMISGHPDPLVRDQYIMVVADRCDVRTDRLRTMGTGPATRPVVVRRTSPVAVGGPEMEALRLVVQRPHDIADLLDAVMFAPGVALEAYLATRDAPDVYSAIEGAAPQVAELLQRAALAESDAEPEDVVNLLLERAVDRELSALKAERRRASPEDQAAYSPTIAWLKLALEQVRRDESDDRSFAREATEALVGWLIARHHDAETQLGQGEMVP
jgi:DNA primase